MIKKVKYRLTLAGKGKCTIRLYRFFGLPIWWSLTTDQSGDHRRVKPFDLEQGNLP